MSRIEAAIAGWSGRRGASIGLLALIIAAAGLTLGFRLGEALVTHQPELRCQASARQMLETGNWIVPYMNGAPRLEKPPLYYWQAATAGMLRGRFDRTALRLPSVVSGLLLLLVLYLWGRSLGGPRTGLLAALCLLLMADYTQYARRGVAEISLTLWTTVSLFLCDRLLWRPRPALKALLALAFILAFLAKATVAVMVVGIPVLLLLVVEKKLGVLARLRTWAWVLGTLAGCLAWYVVIVWVVPDGWTTLRTELLLPVAETTPTDSATHYHGVFYFLPLMLGGTAPACLLAPFALMVALRTRFWRGLRSQRLLVIAFGALLLTVSLIPQKQRHYLLPLMPLVALLLADSTIRLTREVPERMQRWLVGFGTLAAGLGAGLALAGGFYLAEVLEAQLWRTVLWSGGLGVLAGLAWLMARRRWPHLFAMTFTLQTILALLLVHGSLSIWQSRFRSGRLDVMAPAEASRWQRLFAEEPRFRRLMQAREWPAAPARRSGQSRKVQDR